MATQKCPRCGSRRVRRGYRPTSLFTKLTFRYNLLCDSCNWEFIGFAIPGTVKSKTKKRKQDKGSESHESAEQSEISHVEDFTALSDGEKRRRSTKRKIKVKIPS